MARFDGNASNGSSATQKLKMVLSFFFGAAVVIVYSSFQQALKLKDFNALEHVVVSAILAEETNADESSAIQESLDVTSGDAIKDQGRQPLPPPSKPDKLPVEVQHAWVEATYTNQRKLPESNRFYMFDAYRMSLPSGYDPSTSPEILAPDDVLKQTWVEYTMVMGEGKVGGVSFHSNLREYTSDLLCNWSNTNTTTKARIHFMRNRDGTINYRPDGNDMPFSRHDAYMTQYIFCETPPGSPKETLTALKSPLAEWELRVGDTPVSSLLANKEVRQIQDGGVVAPTTGRFAVCVAPVYGGFPNRRWVIEYLEYLRAVGADWVHFPIFDDERGQHAKFWEMLRITYNTSDFLRIHHWSLAQTKGLSNYKKTYEHAKYLAWNDCYLRGRGQVDYVVFIDLDELPVSPSHGQNIGEALRWCDEQFATHQKVGFSLKSVTVTSMFKYVPPSYLENDKLILDQLNYTEIKPLFNKHNNGKYHLGREKYFARTREADRIMPFTTWTHAFSRDYAFSDHFMTLVPPEVLNVRHYTSAWWYVNHGATPKVLVDGEAENRDYNASIAHSILDQMEQQIVGGKNPALQSYYVNFTAKKAIWWANPMIFPS